MVSFRFTNVQHYKRGASWPDGSPRMCIRCGYEGLGRRARATVIATLRKAGSRFKVPVAYCPNHTPEEVSQ
jgi:hypothetical protein